MTPDNDLLKSIRRTSEIRIAERKGEFKEKQDEPKEKNKKRKHENFVHFLNTEGYDTDDYDWSKYNIELGNLILEKRNLELILFTVYDRKSPKDSSLPSEEYEKKLKIVKAKILNTEQKLLQLKPEEFKKMLEEKEMNAENDFNKLSDLSLLYSEYFKLTEKESESIQCRDFDGLEQSMNQKEIMLNKIIDKQNSINFNMLRDLPEKSEKKTKANLILSEIHNKMNKIIEKENQNSVELQVRKKEVFDELGKRNAGARAVSKYTVSKFKPYFVDTTS
ncbi:MAG: hypothetical protein CSB55_00295 [Candidatus Cloacimonadota bacterium]|nr:MAG: hypothetical protein CSB55_00295 [Candidatus Cloacimonadota bacterium]